MKTFVSSKFVKYSGFVPIDSVIYEILNDLGYNRYISKSIIADLIIASRIILLDIRYLPLDNYEKSILEFVSINRRFPVIRGAIELYVILSKRYDLRILESSKNSKAFDMKNIAKSFNYTFKIKEIPLEVQILLDITEDQLNELEELPDDIIEVLMLANEFGKSFKSHISYNMIEYQMQNYGDIMKINKYKFSDPLFTYKFSTKQYFINSESSTEHYANELIFAYFFDSIYDNHTITLLVKLFGVIAIQEKLRNDDIKIIIYELAGPAHLTKIEIDSLRDIIKYFKEPKQLKLFPLDNNKVLRNLSNAHLHANIIFLLDNKRTCYPSSVVNNTKVNIIANKTSKYLLQYANVCKKTNGLFVTI